MYGSRDAGDLRPKIDIRGHTSLVWGSICHPCRTPKLDQWRERSAVFLNLPIDVATRAMTESTPFKHIVVPRMTKFQIAVSSDRLVETYGKRGWTANAAREIRQA